MNPFKQFINEKLVIRENRSISKRALFYLYPGLFKSQQIIDQAVDQLAFLMSADRPDLNIFQVIKLFNLNKS